MPVAAEGAEDWSLAPAPRLPEPEEGSEESKEEGWGVDGERDQLALNERLYRDMMRAGSGEEEKVPEDELENKRAVNVCKRSAMVKRGLVPNMNPTRLNYVSRGWAFRDNFMYRFIL